MLERLQIRNFAVARDITIEPGPGLTVFTGETGAGKSLVVDALAFVLGARRGREVIAAGADRAEVEARFAGPDGGVVVSRVVGASGRSSARIDGATATLDELRALGARLADIHGQSEQLAILRPQVQLGLLDGFAGLDPDRQALAALVRELREVRRRIQALSTDARERERLIDQLTFEADEIDAAGLVPGEDEELRAAIGRASAAGRLLEDTEAALAALDAPAFADLTRALGDITARDPGAGEVADLAALLEAALVDLSGALRRYAEGIEDDPERLVRAQERLDLIARLKRKYGEGIADVLAYAADARERLGGLTGAAESIDELAAREARLTGRASAEAAALSRRRREAAGRLVGAIARELEALGMGGAALAVGIACEDAADGLAVGLLDYEVIAADVPPAAEAEVVPRAFGESGVDRIELLASFNVGEAARPLATVASGGETSRFLLALTTVLGSTGEPRVVVFDEVDEGVGGRAGALVGEALCRLAGRHQVLCITHLPQVAARGDHHFAVTKHADGKRTWSEVRDVRDAARVDELAAMLGTVSDATRQAARELLGST